MDLMRITRTQQRTTEAIVDWYLRTHYGSSDDPGTPAMFCDPKKVGHFAVDASGLARGDDDALFRMLITTLMFQRRQDVQILRILRGITKRDAKEVTTASRLLVLADQCACPLVKSVEQLHNTCDLAKNTERVGTCSANEDIACHLKRHTVLLKRYGHFGKAPTSAALAIREAGAKGLSDLRKIVFRRQKDPSLRAIELESAISRSWRVSQKIASMFLANVSNPDLSAGRAPWSDGIDWSYFVVIDSNVDLYLSSIGYNGPKTYDARREFVRTLSAGVNLKQLDGRLRSANNPRVVQQALYLFMSYANRSALRADCMHHNACNRCSTILAKRCPSRSAAIRRQTPLSTN